MSKEVRWLVHVYPPEPGVQIPNHQAGGTEAFKLWEGILAALGCSSPPKQEKGLGKPEDFLFAEL